MKTRDIMVIPSALEQARANYYYYPNSCHNMAPNSGNIIIRPLPLKPVWTTQNGAENHWIHQNVVQYVPQFLVEQSKKIWDCPTNTCLMLNQRKEEIKKQDTEKIQEAENDANLTDCGKNVSDQVSSCKPHNSESSVKRKSAYHSNGGIVLSLYTLISHYT